MFFSGGKMNTIALMYFAKIGGCIYAGQASVDIDISMDIHGKSVDMDMDGKFHIHGKPGL